MKIRVIVFFAAAALMLSPGGSANAALVIDQSSDNSVYAAPRIDQFTGQIFQATDTNFEAVRFKMNLTSTSDPDCAVEDIKMRMNIHNTAAATDASPTGSFIASRDGNNPSFTGVPTPTSGTLEFDLDYGGTQLENGYSFDPVTLVIGQFYYLNSLALCDSPSRPMTWAYDNTAPYAGGNMVTGFGSGTPTNRAADDLWFQIFNSADITPTTPNAITSPFDGETITSVPFQALGTCDTAEEPLLRVVLSHPDFGVIEEDIVACIVDIWTSSLLGSALFNFDDYILTLFPNTFPDPAFDAISFNVDEPDNPVPSPPQAAVQCSGVSNLFLEGLCDIMTFLFVPNTQTMQKVEGLFDTLSVKPPLGFLTVALAAFNDLEQGVSSEELEGTADLSIWFDPIKAAITAILWLLFAVFLIRRVSTITI